METVTMEEQIAKFKKETGIELTIKDGKPYHNGNLYLYKSKVTSLPYNLVVDGSLILSDTKITELPENLIVNGAIFLQNTQLTSLPEKMTIKGSIALMNTKIKSLPDNLVVNGDLNLSYTPIKKIPDNLVVSGRLDLGYTDITKLPDNLTVGGGLNLDHTNITELPKNLIVGGYLDLQETKIASLPDDLIVGGAIYLDNTPLYRTDVSNIEWNSPQMLSWNNGEYIECDYVFSKVIEHKGNVWKVQELSKEKPIYIVTDGNGRYAHGNTIKQAKADLVYKISNRDTSVYDDLTLDSKVTFEQAIVMYRVITGACEFGTKDFVENRLSIKKDKYTVAELIKLTKGEYQSSVFATFFTNKTA